MGKDGKTLYRYRNATAAFARPAALLLLTTLLLRTLLLTTTTTTALAQAPGPPTDAEILTLMKAHCVMCHAAEPTHPAFARAPAGVQLETVPQIVANAARIMTQVAVTRAMPLGNETGMTDAERDRIAAWIEGRSK